MSKPSDPNNATPSRPTPGDEDPLASVGTPKEDEQPTDPMLAPNTSANPSIKNT